MGELLDDGIEPCTEMRCAHERRRAAGERYWWFCGQLDRDLIRELAAIHPEKQENPNR